MKRILLLSGVSGVLLVFGVFLFTGCGGGSSSDPDDDTPSTPSTPSQNGGVYIGIISFAGSADDVTGGVPVLLDAAGRASLVSKLASSYTIAQQSGTALFYSVHQAFANLKAREDRYPDDLDSVNVITFTDGLDNGSIGKSMQAPIEGQTFASDEEYATYLSGQIASRAIAGKPITAYSVGVRGSDVTNTAKFESDLAKIASAGKSQSLTDFGSLQTTFQGIADSLEITRTTHVAFTMKTTLLANGTKVRMTFDATGTSPSDAAAASKYIEGVISATGSGASLAYTFGSIAYAGGLGSEQGAGPITGVITGTEVGFAFTEVEGYNPAVDESKAKQWLMRPGETEWQVNSEYSVTGATNTEVDSRSSIIYLVLDSSTSLNTAQIGSIRNAAAAFINSVFSQLNGFITSGVSATAVDSSSITVSWGSVFGATSYYVYRSTSSDGTYTRIGSNATISTTSYTDTTNLSPNTTYYYKVSAYNSSSREGAQSSYASATTKAVAPSGVSATAASSTSITVSWGSVSGASGYKVYRSASSSGTYEEVGSNISATSYTDTGLSPSTSYYYKVAAYTDNGEGVRSSPVSAGTKMVAPSDVSATAEYSTSIRVSWGSVSGANGYHVYRSTSSDGTYSSLGVNANTSRYDTGLSPNTTYYYKVYAYNSSSGNGEESSPVSATTWLAAPTSTPTTTVMSSTSITVSWVSVTGATGYKVYRQQASSGGTYEEVGTSSTTSYTDAGLSPNTTYSYKVSAYTTDNEYGAESQSTSAKTSSP